ncbi:MAG: hypothetical protein GY738_09920 [Pseudoalteromonas sp.]|nr:hypothetical protein [Pseudoalteromonas sp.]
MMFVLEARTYRKLYIAGAVPYLSYIRLLLSTSSDYKKDIAATTHGWHMDNSNDFDNISNNDGWRKRAKLIDGSYVITLIGELPLDISSSFKGTIS